MEVQLDGNMACWAKRAFPRDSRPSHKDPLSMGAKLGAWCFLRIAPEDPANGQIGDGALTADRPRFENMKLFMDAAGGSDGNITMPGCS